MRKAILLAGDESCFAENIRKFRDYLVKESGVYSISMIDASEGSNETFVNKFVHAISNIGSEPTLILYNGHGLSGSWCYRSGVCLEYKQIAKSLSSIRAPLMIINDCCYAHSITKSTS